MKTVFFTYRGKHEKQKKMESEKHDKAIKFEAKKENEKRSKKEELLGGAIHLALLKGNRARRCDPSGAAKREPSQTHLRAFLLYYSNIRDYIVFRYY